MISLFITTRLNAKIYTAAPVEVMCHAARGASWHNLVDFSHCSTCGEHQTRVIKQSSQTAFSFVLSLFTSIQTRVRKNNRSKPSVDPVTGQKTATHRAKIIDFTYKLIMSENFRMAKDTISWICMRMLLLMGRMNGAVTNDCFHYQLICTLFLLLSLLKVKQSLV